MMDKNSNTAESATFAASCTGGSSPTKSKKKVFSFEEARRIARGHGFESREEFVEYSCPGAYQLPKDADVVWKDDWRGWDDFLGIPLSLEQARRVAETLDLKTQQEYMELMEQKQERINDNDLASRLVYRPDLKYKDEWISWNDYLGCAE